MPDRFPITMVETAFRRRVLAAAEIVDGVTMEPVRHGLKVTAKGLRRKPIVNYSGFYVWLEDGEREAEEIVVDASATAYQSAREAPQPLPGHLRIELAPGPGYAFPPGVTAFRGTLRESRFGPTTPVAGARVRLQWSDEFGWIDSPLPSTSAANGDFAAVLRLQPKADPRLIGPALAARLLVDRDGTVRTSPEFPLVQGRVGAAAQPVIWDELNP
jgi:hypothetical protein